MKDSYWTWASVVLKHNKKHHLLTIRDRNFPHAGSWSIDLKTICIFGLCLKLQMNNTMQCKSHRQIVPGSRAFSPILGMCVAFFTPISTIRMAVALALTSNRPGARGGYLYLAHGWFYAECWGWISLFLVIRLELEAGIHIGDDRHKDAAAK